jgi:chromosome segregation ATPase
MKTIKQIADELGVSKQAVHKKRRSAALSTSLQQFTSTVDGVVYVSVDGETLLKRAFAATDRQPVDGRLSTTVDGQVDGQLTVLQSAIDALRQELDAKNTQIEAKDVQLAEKDKQIDNLTAALIGAQESARAAQALHAGTIQAQLGDGRHVGLWSRLFRRRDGTPPE